MSSIREVARQNLAANVGPIDFSVLRDVLVLSEPIFGFSEGNEDTSLILDEIDIDIASSEESLNDKNRKTLITYSIDRIYSTQSIFLSKSKFINFLFC